MDKVGIGFTIVIVAVAVAFSTIGGLGSEPYVAPTDIQPTTTRVSELQKEIEVVKKVTEDIQEVAEEAKETTEKAKETTKELATSKLPARLVIISEGAHVPGCEKAGKCYDPPSLIIFKGGEIIWRNDDTNSHTVTGGTALEGPNGLFDSGLMKAGDTFSHRFDSSGEYPYYCMIHPWAIGSISVK